MQSHIPRQSREDLLAVYPDDLVLLVDAASQGMHLYRAGRQERVFPVSTAAKGLGCQEGSYMTPVGWHRVSERIGMDALPGQAFRSREPAGAPLLPAEWAAGEGDAILSRILWLEGLEVENRNSHKRYIYIHGTNQEDLLGTACSHGCVRMANRDVIALCAELTEVDKVFVWIGDFAPDG